MRNRHDPVHTLLAVCLLFLLLTASTIFAESVTRLDDPLVFNRSETEPLALKQSAYGGTLRLFVVEPTSRWSDASGSPFHNAFIDLALDSAVTLESGERIHLSRVWDASSSGFSGFTEDNIKVIAVYYDDESSGTGDSDPYPPQSLFSIYPVHATASATPGTCDSNNTTSSSTHTVFVEEVATTWCENCPAANYYIWQAYLGGSYNFDLVTLVSSDNAAASKYAGEKYNTVYVPTSYYDGGEDILVGGASGASYYTSRISGCESRPTDGIGLMVTTEWLGGGDLEIDVVFAKDAAVNNFPSLSSGPSGEIKPLTGTAYQYAAAADDIDGDQVWYMWDWGNGDVSGWLGPFDAGEPITIEHTWMEVGTYGVRVKAKDLWGSETAWSAPLSVAASCCQVRGNANGDSENSLNVSDLTYMVDYLFRGGPGPVCEAEGDATGDGSINVSDLTFLVDYLFRGGQAPPPCD